MKIKFASIDPSMRNTGIALGTYYVGERAYNVGQVHLVQTFRNTDKKIRASAKDYEACREMFLNMHGILDSWSPSIVFAEMPTGSQSASGMKSYGISLMLLGTIKVPVIQVTPQEVKVAAVDSKNASKNTMIEWATTKWPDLQWMTRVFNGEVKFLNKNEHMADACAAIEAGMRTDQWNQLLSVLSVQQTA